MVEEGLFLSAIEEGFFPWAGPLAQHRHRHRPTGLLPPIEGISQSVLKRLNTLEKMVFGYNFNKNLD